MSTTATTPTIIETPAQARDAQKTIARLGQRARAFSALGGLDEDVAALEVEADRIGDALEAYETAKTRAAGIVALDEARAIAAEARQLEAQWTAGIVALVSIERAMRRGRARFLECHRLATLGKQQTAGLIVPHEPFGLLPNRELHDDPELAIGLFWNLPEAHAELTRRRTPQEPKGKREPSREARDAALGRLEAELGIGGRSTFTVNVPNDRARR